MKKILLSLSFGLLTMMYADAQMVLFDNGPIFDLAGSGSGGANVSTLHDAMGTYGAGHQVLNGNRVADDFTVPPGASWVIDSLVFFAYQTQSGPVSTITQVNVRIWDGPPGAPSTVVFGDSITNLLITSDWSGTYRTGDFTSTTCAPASCIDRPIMRNATDIGTTLAAGTYWVDWQSNGTLGSGPWAPPINLGLGNTTTGNAKQYTSTSLVWADLTDGGTYTPQGLPFLVIGSGPVGVNELDASYQVSVYPNPVTDRATVSMNFPVSISDNYSFIVYDALGKVVNEINNINTPKFTFERSDLNSGVYFYNLKKNDNVVRNGKIVLQ